MPELPEVETMAHMLRAWCRGAHVRECQISRNPGGRYDGAKEFCGPRTIRDVFRRGKIIVFDITGGPMISCHNAMSGYWDVEEEPWTFDYVEGARFPKESDVRVRLTLSSGKHLRFHDARLFGSIKPVSKFKLDSLGPEAIETQRMFPGSIVFSVLDSAVSLSGKKPIKQLLLEQERIAGVGNIYAVEALWRARVHPSRPGVSLSGDEHQAITEAIQQVLKEALDKGLRYSEYLRVYRRARCSRCANEIQKIDVAKRTTYFCVHCQK